MIVVQHNIVPSKKGDKHMDVCQSCLGAKVLPCIGHMTTRECGTCKGKGRVVNPYQDLIEIKEEVKIEKIEVEIIPLSEAIQEIETEITDEPKSKKAGRPPKSKTKWGF